ncbi:MAG: polysaccharide biosynthesis/export family protein [Bacteroides sp.]|jgi:polysaccharide export outer membrane protein|nr:polysaccharide biosynthesis/export family protein [Bacteroides sp.]MCI1684036.1 polysaccharide biosynthesis/export family protein [Bacteroides sp.]
MKKYGILLQGLLILIMSSCASKKMIITEDLPVGGSYKVIEQSQMRIHQDDKLSITVHCSNPELAIPFNMTVGSYQVSSSGDVTAAGDLPVQREKGYLVDIKGNIDFPVLGKMHVEGSTCQMLSSYIKQRLVTESLVKDPIVTVELLNLRIVMLGEVQKIGMISDPDGRMTLVEAIAKSGGLTPNAVPEEVVVIRDQSNTRTKLQVNLRSKSLFDSPAYYLQQNDIVFVTPRSSKPSEKENRGWREYYTAFGLVSFALSLWAILK